jgi:hypothetical protein
MKNKTLCHQAGQIGRVLCVAFLGTLTGCVGYVDGPRAGIATPFMVQDDYVYYPGYECYYSVSRHQYAYPEGNSWVMRPAPRGVPVNVLRASPSVKMNFHDSPAHHHATVVKQYPKNWSPSGSKNQGQGNPGPKEDRKDDLRNGRANRNDNIQANLIRISKGILC